MISGIFWAGFPILRYCLYLITGIILYRNCPSDADVRFIPLTFFLLFFVNSIVKSSLQKRISGILATLILILLGYQISSLNDPRNNSEHLLNQKIDSSNVIKAIVIDEFKETAKTHRYLIRIEEIKTDSIRKCIGKSILYLSKDEEAEILNYGDLIWIQSGINRIEKPENDWEFNYASLMANKDVYHQIFSNYQSVVLIDSGLGSPMQSFAFAIRNSCLEILNKNITEPEIRGVSEALLLGIRKDLDQATKEAFIDAGAIHVLAVSGLHVGIVYQILLLSLGFLKKRRFGKTILFVITVIILFSYALITGFSPSVTRSVLMFSVLAFAEVIGRKSNIYNTLALAAMIILVVNPNMLYDVGFQLSFTAVFGIVYFYPLFTRNVEIDNYILDKAYKLSCVSIGAQITTLPFTLYYFHQFPTFFLISNFIVIPLAGITLVSGVGMFLLSWIPIAESIFSWIHGSLIGIMSKGVFWIQELPFSVLKHVYFDSLFFMLLSIFILLIILLIEYRSKQIGYLLLFILLLITGYRSYLWYEGMDVKKLVLVDQENELFVGFVDGRKFNFNSAEENQKSLSNNYLLTSYLSNKGASLNRPNQKMNQLNCPEAEMWVLNNQVLLKPKKKIQFNSRIPDWMLIDKENVKLRADTLYNPSKGFILGNNIPFFIKSEMMLELRKRGKNYYQLRKDGILELICDGSN